MACHVYRVDLNMRRRYLEGSIQTHTGMSEWLKEHGNMEYMYEVWKPNRIHSRWRWKDKKARWGKLATPRRKSREEKE